MTHNRILTIQDISCVGQCSLTVALPIISACGIECAVLPSAVLSTHTAGFTGFTVRDLADDIPAIEAHWAKEGIDFAAVYTLISRTVRAGCDTLSHRSMLSRLSAFGHGDIGYIKLKIIIRVFQELNLVGIEEPTPENYRFEVRFSTKKTDLDKSSWLHRLRSQIR